MPTVSAPFFYFNQVAENFGEAQANFASNTFKVFLSNQAPSASNAIKSSITEISSGGGYTPGGQTVPIVASSQAGGVYTATVNTTLTWTGTGSGFGPFRYAYMYDDTSASDNLIGAWDWGSAITVGSGDVFEWEMNTALITLQKVP